MSEKYLSGAFSPFTIALQNIRDNLLSKKNSEDIRHAYLQSKKNSEDIRHAYLQSKKNSEDIRHAYLQEIITLSIPIHTETKDGSTALEFPVAACWENKSEDDVILFRYSGQYTPRERGDVKETEDESDKAKLITSNIRNKINKMLRFEEPEIVYENEERPFAGHITDYPESLRKIKGCWKLDCDDLKFLVFFTYVPDSIENPIGQDDREQIRKSFKKCFLSEDAYRYLTRITSIEPNGNHKHEKKDKKRYPVLRDILSNIQRTIDIIAKPDKGKGENSTGVEELSKNFGVVFVLPTIMDQDDKVGFRYILTHRQIRFFEKPGANERIDSLIRGKEKEVLSKLLESHKKCFPNTRIKADCFGEDSSEQLKVLINNLRDNPIRDEYGNIDKSRSGEVEELVRKAIYAYYAFAPKTKTELNHEMFGGGIAEYIESDRGTVQHDQAFLIRHIFNSQSPDVVENFINHPSTKRWKPTNRLIGQMEDDGLYPRALHLLETIFFPKRFFMYPLYQHETPVLLCAFNADFYVESRQSLKSILDGHIQGIFSAILNHELVRANKSFASMTSWSDTETIGQIKRKLRQLLLRFCQEIEKIENIELREIRAADVGSVVGENKGWEFKLSSTTRISLRDDKEQLLTISPDGRRVLNHYTKLYEETVARFRKIVELSRSEEAVQWAHSIGGKLEVDLDAYFESAYSEMNGLESKYTDLGQYVNRFGVVREELQRLKRCVRSLQNLSSLADPDTSEILLSQIPRDILKTNVRRLIVESLRIALIRGLTDPNELYEGFRNIFIKDRSFIDREKSLKLNDNELSKILFENRVATLDDLNEVIVKPYLNINIEISDVTHKASSFMVKQEHYGNILTFALEELFYNVIKGIYREKGEAIIVRVFDRRISPKTLEYPRDRDGDYFPTISGKNLICIEIENRVRNDNQSGTEIGQQFLKNLVDVTLSHQSRYNKAILRLIGKKENNIYRVRFPIFVWSEA